MYRANRCFLSVSFLALWAVGSMADDPVFSGPQPGEPLTSFKVVSVYDETAGKEIDPIKEADGRPTLLVFVHKLTRPGIALTKAVTGYAKSQAERGAASGVIWLNDDKAKTEAYLTRARKSLNIAVPVGVSVDGGEGPGAYGLNRNVELTILVANENKVTANFALVQPSVTEAAKIAGELAKLIDQPAPKQADLEKLAFGNQMRMRARAGARPAGAPDDLRSMMRALIAADASETKIKDSAEAINKWVGENKQRQASLGRMSSAVLERGMGTKEAQSVIKKWRDEYGEKSAENSLRKGLPALTPKADAGGEERPKATKEGRPKLTPREE